MGNDMDINHWIQLLQVLVTLAKGIYSVLYDTLEGQPTKDEFYQMVKDWEEISSTYPPLEKA